MGRSCSKALDVLHEPAARLALEEAFPLLSAQGERRLQQCLSPVFFLELLCLALAVQGLSCQTCSCLGRTPRAALAEDVAWVSLLSILVAPFVAGQPDLMLDLQTAA